MSASVRAMSRLPSSRLKKALFWADVVLFLWGPVILLLFVVRGLPARNDLVRWLEFQSPAQVFFALLLCAVPYSFVLVVCHYLIAPRSLFALFLAMICLAFFVFLILGFYVYLASGEPCAG